MGMKSTSIFAPEVVAVANPKVGDYLCGSYGYEACIYHVYQVVAITGKSVKIREVDLNNKHQVGGMEWTSTITGNLSGPTLTKRFKAQGNEYRVKITDCMNAYGPWTPTILHGYNYH